MEENTQQENPDALEDWEIQRGSNWMVTSLIQGLSLGVPFGIIIYFILVFIIWGVLA